MVSEQQKQKLQEDQHTYFYSKFIDDNPDLIASKDRRLAFLRSHKVPKGSYIHNFFMQDLNVDNWFSQKPEEEPHQKENPKNSDKAEFKPLRRRK